MSRLNGGYRAFFGHCGGQKLGGAGGGGLAQVKVVGNHQEKRLVSGESRGTMHGVPVTQGVRLLDEMHVARVRASGFLVGRLVTRTNDDRDFLNPGCGDFAGEDGEDGFRNAVTIHKRLQRQSALGFASRSDYSFFHIHKTTFGRRRRDDNLRGTRYAISTRDSPRLQSGQSL